MQVNSIVRCVGGGKNGHERRETEKQSQRVCTQRPGDGGGEGRGKDAIIGPFPVFGPLKMHWTH